MNESGRLTTVLKLAQWDAIQHSRSPRMIALVVLLALFVGGGSWGLADPDSAIAAEVAAETPYEILFLVSLFILLSATLGVVLLGFDGISRKRLTGELALELAQPISRDDLAIANVLGLWFAVFIPTAYATLWGVVLIFLQMGDWPTLVDVLYFLMATGLVLLWYSAIQLLASSLARDMGTAVTLGIGVWMMFTLVWLLITAILASLMGVDVTNLESDSYNRFSEMVDLFSPNGVYQLLLEDRLAGDAAPTLASSLIWVSAFGWTIIPLALFLARFRRLRP